MRDDKSAIYNFTSVLSPMANTTVCTRRKRRKTHAVGRTVRIHVYHPKYLRSTVKRASERSCTHTYTHTVTSIRSCKFIFFSFKYTSHRIRIYLFVVVVFFFSLCPFSVRVHYFFHEISNK